MRHATESIPLLEGVVTTLFISHSSKDKAWAERTHAALAAGGYQCLFLDSHPDDGIHAGADWEQTLYQRLRQSRGVVVLCSAHWLASPWCVAEAMMARDRGKRVILLAAADIADGRQAKATGNEAAAPIPEFLKHTQLVSLGDVTEDEACHSLLHGLEKEGLKKEDFALPARPYPGLEPFQETDAAVYFGRDAEIDQVIAVLNRRRRHNAHGFTVVLGASGCGKSSLVRAGVLPRLRRAGGDNGTRAAWVIVPPFLGGRGRDGLALSVASAFREVGRPRNLAAIHGRLGAGTGVQRLGNEILYAHGAPEGAVLLVLDQLEEVFTTPDDSEPRALLRRLLDASADAASPVIVLATMRSDFLNVFQQFEGAAERYEKITLDPMPRSRFAEVIEGPADRFGLDLDAGLAKRMAEETAYNDALPLLAFTLERLYDTCQAERRLTLKVYAALGGVAAAIKHAADATLEAAGYQDLPAEDERMRDLRRAFYSLAQVGEEGQFTRRSTRWSRLPASCAAILKRFVGERLLVSSIDDKKEDDKNEPTLSVAHEALFRVWDSLNAWLRKDRKALALRSQIEEAAAEWYAQNRAESRAWPEERILDAVREIESSGVSLADVTDPKTVDAFLGPTDRKHLEALPALDAAADGTAGIGRYGEAWRLPLSHEARASVGVRLGLLGDRRKGVGLRADGLPDIDWVRIDSGEVTIDIRANPEDPNSQIRKRLTRPVEAFRMARYPVTIAQFRAFLDACHRDGEWHLPPGFMVNLSAEYPPPKHRARFENHPADNVNWYDAMAFCHWLSSRLGFEVRLPTEYEWQLAATVGDGGRLYPWGGEWDPQQEPWRANTFESELGGSTAVGMYPAGRSAGGLLDMTGTLWEWCLDPFETSETRGGSWLGRLLTKPSVERDRRVLRGGSWDLHQDDARSAYRYGNHPYYRSNDVGFRVVCSSPSSGTVP
jgi:formylglycine-generating enzyme required for sulfatase activity